MGQNLENPDVIIDDVVALFVGRIAWLVIPIFMVLLLVDVLLMRRLLGPIIAASHVASSIGPDQPLLRLPTGDLPREVLPLAEAVNEALDRLEKSLQAQREFTADAAHELRTPLAILRTHVDTILDAPAAAALQSDIDAMSHVLDQLLELAELESFAISHGERDQSYRVGRGSGGPDGAHCVGRAQIAGIFRRARFGLGLWQCRDAVSCPAQSGGKCYPPFTPKSKCGSRGGFARHYPGQGSRPRHQAR